ncbi:hypothetical protein BJV74DRAFT_868448 [Russula compacta]|nr:hypothetical protein BJV74DRAFT_868448 [Russula compacta]
MNFCMSSGINPGCDGPLKNSLRRVGNTSVALSPVSSCSARATSGPSSSCIFRSCTAGNKSKSSNHSVGSMPFPCRACPGGFSRISSDVT